MSVTCAWPGQVAGTTKYEVAEPFASSASAAARGSTVTSGVKLASG